MCDSSISVRPKVATRSTTNVWLIGHPIPVLDNSHFNQLPTVKEVLCRLFYDLKTNKLTLSVSLSNVIDELYQLWQIAHIPTTQKPNAVAKLRKFYLKYVSICKSKSRRSNHQIELERIFVEQLKMLFDISHADSQHLIKIPQDWEFLQDQLTARNMIMAGEDKIFKRKEELKQKRKSEEHQRCEKAKKIASSEEKITVNFDECTSTSSSTSTNESDEPVISKYHQQQVIKSVNEFNIDAIAGPSGICKSAKSVSKRQVLDNPMFISSLDRTKTTSREAMHIVAPALKAVGVDMDDITLSAASIHRSRKTVRKSIVDSTKQVFSPNTPLVCHFDSKLLPDHDGTITDRLPVVVSGFQVEKLLGIPKIPTGTGIQMANAIIQLLTNWEGVNECVAGLCFDTTSVNTGVHTGAITVIQKSFNKHLLFLACRHHILELLATAVFDKFFTSSAPQITLFSRFKDYWPFLDQSNYAPIDKDTLNCVLTNEEKNWLDLKRQDIVEFLCTQLKNQPRDDYLEFIKLSLITLGKGELIPKVKFSPPGAYHRARWMAKGIYCLKIFCFREHFKLSKHELQALKRICLFLLTIYIKAWFSSTSSTDAPINDLCLLKILEKYMKIDDIVAKTAYSKLKGQLWYLSEDLVPLALFSDNLLLKEKISLAKAMKKQEKKQDLRRLDATKIKTFSNKNLSNFASKRSMNLFLALKINFDFLDSDPQTWGNRVDYLHAKEKVASLKIVNDSAERAVKLASDFNMVLTHDEDQRQLIFQVIEYHRQILKHPLKKNF